MQAVHNVIAFGSDLARQAVRDEIGAVLMVRDACQAHPSYLPPHTVCPFTPSKSCQEVVDGGGGGGVPEQELYLQAIFTLLDVLGRWYKDLQDTLSILSPVTMQPQQAAVRQLVGSIICHPPLTPTMLSQLLLHSTCNEAGHGLVQYAGTLETHCTLCSSHSSQNGPSKSVTSAAQAEPQTELDLPPFVKKVSSFIDNIPKKALAQAAFRWGCILILQFGYPFDTSVHIKVASHICFSHTVRCGAHARALQYFETYVRLENNGAMNPAAYSSVVYKPDQASACQSNSGVIIDFQYA